MPGIAVWGCVVRVLSACIASRALFGAGFLSNKAEGELDDSGCMLPVGSVS